MSTYALLGTVVIVLDVVAIISILFGAASVGHKVFWTLVVLIFPLVGMIVYYLIGRSPRDAQIP
ncbi:MAG: PLDc N-terminal domain-containing protein [Gammaproteobacteria bacterium]|nr:PLDc N-terminal domain-containing protein [Gammaproteobacteria bacterium]